MVPNTVETTASSPSSPLMSPQIQNKQLGEVSEGPLFTDGVSAYRAHFSCQFTGKVKARSKRKITWRFGLCTNAPDGSRRVIREEHQVELTWSINSGKTSLLWNNRDISHFFPSTKSSTPPTVVDYNWQSSSGVAFQIEAHALPLEDQRRQYELYIGGRSFFSLPSASEFLAMRRSEAKNDVPVRVTPDKETPTSRPTLDREVSQMTLEEDETFPEVPKNFHRHDVSSSCTEDDSDDALRSDLYSSSLDALRGEMTSAVPELEEMMSRAIVYAYSEDHDSLGGSIANDSFGSFATEDELDPAETEADVLCETYDWMKWTTMHEEPTDLYDLKLEFMRSQVDSMVAHARHERLSPHVASSIMIGIAAILNLKLARRMQRSTVILVGLPSDITTKEVYRAVTVFGQIETVCTASITGDGGFAVCRFATEASADALCRCTKSELPTLGKRFEAFNLFAKPFLWSTARGGPRRVSTTSTPRHRRHGGDLTMTAEHLLAKQETEGVELYEVPDEVDGAERRTSLQLEDLLENDKLHRRSTRKNRNGKSKPLPNSLEFSSSTLKQDMSTGTMSTVCSTPPGTMSTLSTFDGEDINFSVNFN